MVRIKHRYLLINVLYPQDASNPKQTEEDLPWPVKFRRPSSDRFDAKLLTRMVRDGVSDLFGDYGSAMVGGSLQVKYCSSATNTAIIRVARAHYRLVWAALSFVTKLPRPVDQPCVIQVIRISGTIKKSEEEAIRRARLTISRAQRGKTNGNAIADATVDHESDVDMLNNNGIEDVDGDEDDEDEDD